MQPIAIEDPHRPQLPDRFALLGLGFRPFFLAAGISATLLIPLWLLAFQGGSLDSRYYHAPAWHQHEMIFGFGLAVVAGFLLTAVQNWTSLATPRGLPLAGLLGLWLLGRVLVFLPAPDWLLVTIDWLFAPVIALVISRPLWRARQWTNLVFPALLLLIAAGNALFHLERLGLSSSTASLGSYLGLMGLVWIMVIMGGRVIPFFIEKGLAGTPQVQKWPWIEYAAHITLAATIVTMVADLPATIQAASALLAASIHAIRVLGWHDRRLWSVPLLWVLWIGYGWLVLGLVLQGAAALGAIPFALALHSYAAGALGTLAIGMMARVAIGHTGRPMQLTSPLMAWAFALTILSGLLRVVIPLITPELTITAILLSGAAWTVAFMLFSWVYAPILWRPRVDGRPG